MRIDESASQVINAPIERNMTFVNNVCGLFEGFLGPTQNVFDSCNELNKRGKRTRKISNILATNLNFTQETVTTVPPSGAGVHYNISYCLLE